jgi:hypothetical protein
MDLLVWMEEINLLNAAYVIFHNRVSDRFFIFILSGCVVLDLSVCGC